MIQSVVQQHAEEAATLYTARAALLDAPHVTLEALQRMDTRIAAHLEGLAVAKEAGWSACEALLAEPWAGEVFVGSVRALCDSQLTRLGDLMALVQSSPELTAGLLAGFGWAPQERLRGVVAELLRSDVNFRRQVAVAACVMHAMIGKPILAIVEQHASESAALRDARSQLLQASHIRLDDLLRMDDQLAAHLDGLAVAGETGWKLCEEALANIGVGEVFTATVRVIKEAATPPIDASKMTQLYDLKFQCNGKGQPLKPAKDWPLEKQLGGKQRRCYEKIKLDPPRGAGEPNPNGVKVDSVAPTSENCK